MKNMNKKLMAQFVSEHKPAEIDKVFSVGGEEVSIKIKPYVSLQQYSQMVLNIADGVCFNNNYAPYFAEYAKTYWIVKTFTNLNLEADEDILLQFVGLSGLLSEIDNVSNGQSRSASRDADLLIAFRMSNKMSNTQALAERCIGLFDNIDEASALIENLNRSDNSDGPTAIAMAGVDKNASN